MASPAMGEPGYRNSVGDTRGNPAFAPGHPRYGGRARGTPNKITRDLVELVLAGLREAGEDGKGLGGQVGWLKRLAVEYPTVMAQLLHKMLPTNISAALLTASDITHTHRVDSTQLAALSADELASLYREAVQSTAGGVGESGRHRH